MNEKELLAMDLLDGNHLQKTKVVFGSFVARIPLMLSDTATFRDLETALSVEEFIKHFYLD